MKRKYFLFTIFLALINVSVHAQKVINLSDYGVTSNSFQNESANIARAIKDAAGFDSCIIKFPGGRIDLWPEGAAKETYFISNNTESDSLSKNRTIGMLFKNLSNITLEGNNTLLVYHGKMMQMAIDHCYNFKVEDLHFDFQRPTMSEMKIISKSDSDVIVNINPDSWYAIEKDDNHNKLIWYGEGWKTNNPFLIRYVPSQETMHYGSWKFFSNSNATELSPFKVKFDGDFKDTKFEPGDILTIRDPYRDEVGIFNNFSSDVTFDNLKFYYVHGMGIVSQMSRSILIKNVDIAPKPGSGRVIAAFADCFHFSGCYGVVQIEDCVASGSHDDGVNIHGTALRIIKADSNKLTVRFMHHQTWGFNAFEKNDSIEFVNHKTLLPFGTAVVKTSKIISQTDIELELNTAVPKEWQKNDCVENISKTPSVIIRNNRFEHTETRGVLVTTRRNVLIEGNTFFRLGKQAISISEDCNSWFESGPVKSVTIRNNKFIDCGYNLAPQDYIISIKPETNNFGKDQFVNSSIRIVNNKFQVFDSPLLAASNVNGIDFSGNEVIQKPLSGFPSDRKAAFILEHCKDVRILNNHLVGGSVAEIQIKNMGKNKIEYKPEKDFKLIEK